MSPIDDLSDVCHALSVCRRSTCRAAALLCLSAFLPPAKACLFLEGALRVKAGRAKHSGLGIVWLLAVVDVKLAEGSLACLRCRSLCVGRVECWAGRAAVI